jgi:hypothetical protein
MICISVIGSAGCTDEQKRIAYDIGRLIAKNKAVLICGGLGGVMEAASKGAKDEGGLALGVMPGTDNSFANTFIDIPIVTGIGEARNIIVALSGDAVIAVGGALGTLSELAFAMKYKKPVIGIDTWNLDDSYCEKINLHKAGTAEESVKKAFELIKR